MARYSVHVTCWVETWERPVAVDFVLVNLRTFWRGMHLERLKSGLSHWRLSSIWANARSNFSKFGVQLDHVRRLYLQTPIHAVPRLFQIHHIALSKMQQ